MFLEHYFDRYTFQPEKGLAYGFEKKGAGYEYQCPVLSDTFLLNVQVCDRKISFQDRKSTRLNSSHSRASRMPSSA